MTQIKRRIGVTRRTAATNDRNFRTFLLVSQLEAQAIGERIAQARREAGLTQEEVADLATFSKRSLQDYEAGVTIPYKHMREIARLLNRPVPWFLHGDAEESIPSSLERLDRIEAQLAAILEALARVARDEDDPPSDERAHRVPPTGRR